MRKTVCVFTPWKRAEEITHHVFIVYLYCTAEAKWKSFFIIIFPPPFQKIAHIGNTGTFLFKDCNIRLNAKSVALHPAATMQPLLQLECAHCPCGTHTANSSWRREGDRESCMQVA